MRIAAFPRAAMRFSLDANIQQHASIVRARSFIRIAHRRHIYRAST
jgi:hypothetical protein